MDVLEDMDVAEDQRKPEPGPARKLAEMLVALVAVGGLVALVWLVASESFAVGLLVLALMAGAGRARGRGGNGDAERP